MTFDSLVPGTKWPVGANFSDKLTNRLMATRRYVVLERAQYSNLLNEYHRARRARQEENSKLIAKKLSEVRYTIKGTVTDFGPYTIPRYASALLAIQVH